MAVNREAKKHWSKLGKLLCAGGIAATLSVGATTPPALAKPGSLDRNFATRGKLVVRAGKVEEAGRPTTPMAMASAPDGKLVAADRHRVFEFLANGKPNPGFGVGGRVKIGVPSESDFFLATVAVDSRGRVLVAGTTRPSDIAHSPGPPEFPGPPPAWATVYRYLPNGRLDPSFGTSGVVASGFDQMPPNGPGPAGKYPYQTIPGEYPYPTASVEVRGMTIDADDRPVIVGLSISRVTQCGYVTHSLAYLSRSYIARLNADGSPDSSFGGSGVVTDPYNEDPDGLAVGSSGQIVYAAPIMDRCLRVPQESEDQVVSLLDDGAPNQSFGEGGRQGYRYPGIRAIEVDRHGRLVLLRSSEELEATTIQRILPDGSPDMEFGRGGSASLKLPTQAEILDLAVDRHGRVLLSGSALSKGGAGHSFLLMRLSAAGKIEPGFGHRGQTRTSFFPSSHANASQISIDERGRIILGGTLTSQPLKAKQNRFAFARYLSGGR